MNKNRKPDIHYLDELLKAGGIDLHQRQVEFLWKYHKLIRQNNDDHDLTRLIKFETIVTKHYIDCMMVAKLTELPSPLIDVGTGAGFPGIPLKLIKPELKICLAEPRHKRVDFLKMVIQELKLKDIDVYPHKIYSDTPLDGFSGVITRALELIPESLARFKNLLKIGGQAIFMKGPNCSEEIREAETASPDFKLFLDLPYSISKEDKRRLVIFSRLQ